MQLPKAHDRGQQPEPTAQCQQDPYQGLGSRVSTAKSERICDFDDCSDETHFAQRSAFWPLLLLTRPKRDKQNTSSDSALPKSIKWPMSTGAVVGFGDKRWVRG